MYSVLYVDDEAELLEICKLFLELEGQFSVDTLTSAEEALTLIQSKNYDAIISDYQMPEMDGIAFLKQVRGSGNTIPFILFTGRGREEIVIQALNEGADFYLQKGGEPRSQFTELGHKIRSAVSRKKAEEELKTARDVLEDRVRQRTADLYTANLQLQSEIETRKQTDSALRESEERFRILIEKAPEAILLFDMDLDRYIDANARAEQLFGCSRQQLLDAGPQQFYLADQFDGLPFRETVIEHRKRALAGAELVFERRIRNARGEDRIVEVRLVHLPSSTKKLIRSSFVDITDRKRFEVALKESEERYRAIVEHDYRSMFENIQDVFYRTDAKGILTLITPSGARLLGYAGTDEMIGRAATEYYADPVQRDRFLTSLKMKGAVSNSEITLKRKDGALVIVSTSSHVYYDASGSYAGVEGIFRDITRFKRVQEELRQSEEKYRILVMHSQDGAFLMQDGILQFCNEAFAAMIGCNPADIIGTPVPDLIAPEDREMVMERQRSRLAGASLEESYEFRMLHRDKTTRVPVILSVGIGTFKNRPAVIGTVRDVTKEREREYALRESEEKYRALVESSFDGIVIHQDGVIVFANATAASLIGAGSADEVVGKPILSFVHPEFRQVVIQRMHTAIGEAQPVITEKFLRTDGIAIDVDVAAVPFVWKNRPAVHVVFRDISERKRAEEALMERERKIRAVFDSTYQFTAIMTPDGILTDVNSTALGYGGVQLPEVINRPFRETTWWRGNAERVQRLKDAIGEAASGKFIRYEVGLQGIGNTTMFFDFSIKPVFDQNGKVALLIAEARDITDRKRTEDAFCLTSKKLGILSGITRHDINNQLLALRSYLALLETKGGDPVSGEYFRKAKTSAESISAMIQFTGEYESIGINTPVWQNLRTLVETVIRQAPVGTILVKNDLPAGAEVYADPLIVKVFYNLMENAVRHGENVTTIRFSGEERNGGYRVVYEDDGAGVLSKDKERIFERGFGKNTGLGLFLCREILSITGITIRETSEPGNGARFEMTVPNGKYRI